MSLAKTLKKSGVKIKKQRSEPLWKGPEQDGITQSLLSKFICCRERFRLYVVEGLTGQDNFYAPLEFGNMWHVCEEVHAGNTQGKIVKGSYLWQDSLKDYCKQLCKQYKTRQAEVNDWYEKCKALFPLYVEYWSKHPDVRERTPLLQEQTFNVPYLLLSGRTVRLRGKWDSVDLIGKGKAAGIYLQENKNKSSINEGQLKKQLQFDLQTMLYLVALEESLDDPEISSLYELRKTKGYDAPVCGVRYNVIKRSSHKSVESMLKKVEDDRADGRIGEWFSRWKVEILPGDIERFKTEFLTPILEQLCDWWEWITCGDGSGSPFRQQQGTGKSGAALHWVHPHGVYNPLLEGGSSELDSYLAGEGEVGLTRVSDLFPELSPE